MRTVLARPGVPFLLAASFVGRLPSSVAALALVRLVVDGGGGFAFASTVTAVYIVGLTVGQPVLARVVDRTGRRRPVLVAAALAATAGFVGTALSIHAAPAIGLVAVAVAGIATPPIESVLRSLWPVLFHGPGELGSAYAVDATVQELSYVVGPLLTAGGILLFGSSGNVVAAAAIGLLGAIAFTAHPHLRRVAPVRPEPGDRHGSPLASRAFPRLLVLVVTSGVSVGALTITATAFGEHSGDRGLGPLAVALNGVGALTGALLAARFRPRRDPAELVRPLGLALAALYLPTALAEAPPWLWLAGAAVSGVALPALLAQVFALTPTLVDPRHANEANAWVISGFSVGVAVGTILPGLVIDALGPGPGIAVSVVACAAIGLAGAAQGGRRAFCPGAAGGPAAAVAAEDAPPGGAS